MSAVLEEHLGYFRLPHRLDLYTQAIKQAVKPGDVVADLGCGFGVLGLLCLKNGASKVYGIDSSGAIEIAREMASKAGLASQYECMSASTFDAELPEKVDVIICDHVGWFGLDYGIVAMMRDGAERFLKPGARIIPERVELSLAGVSSQECVKLLDDWTGPAIPSEFHWLRDYSAHAKHGHSFKPNEIISREELIGGVELDGSANDHLSFSTELLVEKDAVFHGLAGWFTAHLSTDVTMTNSPLSDKSIERLQVFLAAEQPFDVKQGDTVEIALKWRPDDSIMAWTIQPPGDAPKQKMSTWNSTILSASDLACQSGEPASLNDQGKARQYVLSLVDGERTPSEIEAKVLAERPDLRASERAVRDFVKAVLSRDCA